MRRLWVLLVLTLCGQALAQEGAVIYGRVRNAVDDTALQFVSVSLSRGGEQLGGALTDAEGYFELAGLPPATYQIRAALAGFASTDIPVLVFAGNDSYNLGTIELAAAAASQAIEEITVLGQAVDGGVSLDNRIYSLDNNAAQSAGSLLDVMRTLPGVTVEQDGRIQLRGSDRVVILIDGKQSSLTGFGNQAGLDSIPATGIASVEIINNPSSRFDATGMAGVINITYAQNRDYGLAGDMGISVGVGQLDQRRADLPTDLGSFTSNIKTTPSLNLNYNTDDKRFFLLTQLLQQEDLPNNEFATRYYDDGRVTYSQVPENREQIQYIVNGGMDWNIGDSSMLTLSAIFDFEEHEDNAEVPYINGSDGQRYRFWFWREEEVTGFFNFNSSYEYRFAEPGHELNLSLQYTRGWEDEDYFLNDRSALRNASDSTHLRAEENTLPLQIDYIKPLSAGRMELGAKYQKRWIPVQYDVVRGQDTIIYDGLGDWSEWGETTSSLYANLVLETLRFGVEGGVRLEQNDVYYEIPPENIYYPGNDEYDYFRVYPNFKLSYKLNEENRLALYYNSRVDRPGEAELRIFAKYDDPELLKVGNPYLRPQFTTSTELAFEHLWDSGSVMLSLYARDIEDPFMRVFDIDDSNPDYDIVNRIYQNVGAATNTGVELIYSQDFADYWSVSGSANWYRNSIDAYQTEILFPRPRPFNIAASEDDTWTANLNNQITLPYSVDLNVSFTYYAAKNFAQGEEAARSSLDLGLSRTIGDDYEVVFTVVDMFNDFGIRQNIEGNGFRAVYENYFESQVVSLGIKRFF